MGIKRNGAEALANFTASIAARFRAGRHMARVVDAEAVRQWRGRQGEIPEDSGDTRRAMTNLRSGDRETNTVRGEVQVVVKTPGAYWQADRLPGIDSAEMAKAVGEETFSAAASDAGVTRR